MKTLFRVKYWSLLIDIGVILICILVSEGRILVPDNKSTLTFLISTSREAFNLLPLAKSAGQIAALLVVPIQALLFYIGAIIVGSAFLPVAYFGFFKARLRVISQKRLRATEKDLYYFRDTFSGIKPATLSLLIDLEMDTKKDVAASLLQMVDKGSLKLDANGFAPGATQVCLSESERELTRFALGKISDLSSWKTLCTQEAIATGYVQKTGSDDMKQQMRNYWIAALICWSFAMIVGPIVDVVSNGFGFFGATERGLENLWIFFHRPSFATDVLFSMLFWVVVAAFIAGIALLVYIVSFESRYKKLKSPLRRTKQGERIARLLYGIKNYIHDFSRLSEAAKEQVILWNDFLVYAIVLEENTTIVKDISRYYPPTKLSLLKAKYFD